MSAELEELGFSATAATVDGEDNQNQNLPFVDTGTEMNSNAEPTTVSSGIKGNANSNATSKQMPAKRPAAEISSDEESSGSTKARRVSTARSSPSTTATTRIIAPKPTTAKSGTKATSATAKKIFVGGSAGSIRVDHLGRRVNTSTAHVQALIGVKGAAMCFEIVAGTHQDTTVPIPNLASTDLTAEEKSKFSRDRNRLHARNTRIRKKAYVDELKRTLDVLVEERDTDAAAKTRKAQVELEERDVRFSVMEEYLRLRGSNEQATGRWSAILEDDVTMRLPNLDWHDSNSSSSKRASAQTGDAGLSSKTTVSGLRDIMKESNLFAQQWLQSGSNTKKLTPKKAPVGTMLFHCDRKSLLMEGTNVVLDWTATSSDPAKKVCILVASACWNSLFYAKTSLVVKHSSHFCVLSFPTAELCNAWNLPSKV